jgi:hypothetical protein
MGFTEEFLILVGLVVGWQFNCTPGGGVEAGVQYAMMVSSSPHHSIIVYASASVDHI